MDESLEKVRLSETEQILQGVIETYVSSNGKENGFESLRDQFFSSDYQTELKSKGVLISGMISPKKVEILAKIPESLEEDKDRVLRVFVKARRGGPARIEITKGWEEWPIKEYPLPATFEEARAKLKDIIDTLPGTLDLYVLDRREKKK